MDQTFMKEKKIFPLVLSMALTMGIMALGTVCCWLLPAQLIC